MAIPTEELQKANPSAKIELFEIHLVTALHGSSDVSRFHNGINMNTTSNVVFQGQSYTRIPVEATGFEYSIGRKTLPRPTLKISNLFSTVSALMQEANLTTPKNDLNGAKVKRIVTMLKFIDNASIKIGNDTNGDGVPDEYFNHDSTTGEYQVPFTEDASYGAEFNPNLMVRQWDSYDPTSPNYGKATPWVAAKNGPIKFFEPPITYVNSISLEKGNKA